MWSLVTKELKEFSTNIFALISILALLVITYLFLWVFPDSAYPAYGLAESDLYFDYLSYLLLFVVPVFTIGLMSSEYGNGTLVLLRSLGLSWPQIILSKFVAALIILGSILVLTSIHLLVVDQLSLLDGPVAWRQWLGSFIGILGIGTCYIGISLLLATYIKSGTIALLVSVIICFTLYTGLALLADLPQLGSGMSDALRGLSLSYHADQISLGILRLSSIFYMTGLIVWSLWMSSIHLRHRQL